MNFIAKKSFLMTKSCIFVEQKVGYENIGVN